LDIEDQNIESLVELGDYVPGLMIFSNGVSGGNSPSMRGLRAPVESFTASTGLFIDGVPVLSAAGFEDSLLDNIIQMDITVAFTQFTVIRERLV
jgi:iron complex outermembrane receptor protein